MKTKAQTQALLAKLVPATKADELAITHYCEKTLHIKAKFSETKSKTFHTISYDNFEKWIERKDPELGDIIVYDKTKVRGTMIAIIRAINLNTFTSGCTWTAESMNIQDNEVPSKGWRKPDPREIQEMKSELSIQGLEWSRRYCRVVEKYVPRNGDFVNLYRDDKLIGRGILNELKENGDVFMYSYQIDDEPVKYSMNMIMGTASEFEFEICSVTDRNAFLELLNQSGKVWNGYVKRIEPVNMRVPNGEAYWFLNDKLAICTCHDTNGAVDKKRYIAGNYFNDIEKAFDAKSKLYDVILNQLCLPII